MYQLIYVSIFYTHYWHEGGMLYHFTMGGCTCKDTLFLSVLHHYTCIRVHATCEYQKNTCTAVNMHSGEMDALTSGSGKINVQHAPKSLCC